MGIVTVGKAHLVTMEARRAWLNTVTTNTGAYLPGADLADGWRTAAEPCARVVSHILVVEEEGAVVEKARSSLLFNLPEAPVGHRQEKGFVAKRWCPRRTTAPVAAGPAASRLRRAPPACRWVRTWRHSNARPHCPMMPTACRRLFLFGLSAQRRPCLRAARLSGVGCTWPPGWTATRRA